MTLTERKISRIYYLDLLRVIACFSVIMIHSSAFYVVRDIGSINFWFGTLLNSLSRIAVPLFVMVSGALMLDESYAFSIQKLAKHVKKMLLFFVFWSAFYCVIFDIASKVFNHQPFDLYGLFLSFVRGYTHLWFVPMIIGLYLIVPLLRLWVKDENKKAVEYYLLLSFLFTFLLPQIVEIGNNYGYSLGWLDSIISGLKLQYVGGFTLYYILGWYLRQYEVKNKTALYILGIIGVTMSLFGTYLLSSTTGKEIQLCSNISVNVLFQSVAVFVYVKANWSGPNHGSTTWVDTVAMHSLGIYAIHMVIVKIMYKVLIFTGINSAIISIPLVFLCSFGIAFLGAVIFSRIPVLKKVV